jgi:hypothetical protein
MKALSDPIFIGTMVFSGVMILGYFSSKWQRTHMQDRAKDER